MTYPVAIVPRFEPQPFWHLSRKRVFVALFYRPLDLCFGLQFMFGGAMLHLWPISIAVIDPRRVSRSKPEGSRRETGSVAKR